jgi:hypothetical protein
MNSENAASTSGREMTGVSIASSPGRLRKEM